MSMKTAGKSRTNNALGDMLADIRRNVLAWALWVACGIIGAYAGWNLPILGIFVGDIKETPDWVKRVLEKDPVAGRKYSLPPVYDLTGNPVKLPVPGARTAIVCLWTCDTCGVDKFVRELTALCERRPKTPIWVVVNRGKPDRTAQFWKDNGLTLPVAVDTDGSLGRQLNSQFMYRAYIFDSSGNLTQFSSYRNGNREVIVDWLAGQLPTS